MSKYPKAEAYLELEVIYSQCNGPGGLKLSEFIANKLNLLPGNRILDVGVNRGYQTCFLAKEYNVSVIGIDPWDDRQSKRPHIAHLMDNAKLLGVEDSVIGMSSGVPDTKFAGNTFDAVYCSTALEMMRADGDDKYRECLSEIKRVLRPGSLFGLAEPMCLSMSIPSDLAPLVSKGGKYSFKNCLATIEKTVEAFRSVGFEIIEKDYIPEAKEWWGEFLKYDPTVDSDELQTFKVDAGRWISLGYVIAKKPE